jgi:predicted PurR-regulated permease PerM
MTSSQAAQRFFFILLVVVTVLTAMVARPLATALFLAVVLAGVLWPVHRRLTARLWKRATLSAGVLVLGIVILILGPLVAFSTFAIKEGADGLRFLSGTLRSEGVTGLVDRLPGPLQRVAHLALQRLPSESDELARKLQEQVTAQGGKAAAAVGAALSATGALVFQLVMMLIALYFLLIQGEELVGWLDRTSPLQPGQTRELLFEFKKVSYAVIVSTVITAAVQAAAALVGYLITRVPNPIFFAGVTFFVAFIPALGAASVCLLAALLLFVTGHPYAAIFLAAWGVLVVGLVDNVVKPLLIRAGMEMAGALVFFALVGGIGAFGAVGLLVGPLVVASFLTLLRMYERDFKPNPAG